MVDQARADAYNSWWQFRNDSWSRLEEATARINSSRRRGKAIDQQMTDAVHEQCAALAPGTVLGVSSRRIRCRPGACGGWKLGKAWTAGVSDQPGSRHRVIPYGLLGDIAYAEHRADDDDMVFGVSHDHLSRPYFEFGR